MCLLFVNVRKYTKSMTRHLNLSYIYFINTLFTLLNLNLFTLDIYHLVSLLYKE